eukprot:TRINITY_DN3375_c2_g1_i2.p1 TRINITY_DN3375_c2_g1~~TRINITY_DN3375_c2_g1_i2.p1  ORF type:complete len:118 (-),score=7.62 TRINITY_DN3375_c2_g1_i2:172-525(-)
MLSPSTSMNTSPVCLVWRLLLEGSSVACLKLKLIMYQHLLSWFVIQLDPIYANSLSTHVLSQKAVQFQTIHASSSSSSKPSPTMLRSNITFKLKTNVEVNIRYVLNITSCLNFFFLK